MIKKNKVLVTGALGFIGYHLTLKLINIGFEVIGIDNINNYYDNSLKYSKLPTLGIDNKILINNVMYSSNQYNNFKFAKIDITDRDNIESLFNCEKFELVYHLAAQAGVQYSIKNPHEYIDSNIVGFNNIIDSSIRNNVKHMLYASSSSVYGNSLDAPFNENNITDKPISLYAATKRSNELIAYAYSHIHNFKVTGLRFFTVYGPWGRPDMAPYIFVDKIAKGKEITVYNNGNMIRDFTYVDDIVSGIVKLSHNNKTKYNYKIYNIGNSKPIILNEFIKVIEKKLNKRAIIRYDNVRKGDVLKTHADITSITNDTEYNPSTNVEDGMSIFIDWMKRYNLI